MGIAALGLPYYFVDAVAFVAQTTYQENGAAAPAKCGMARERLG
jgi:hypothetical protein